MLVLLTPFCSALQPRPAIGQLCGHFFIRRRKSHNIRNTVHRRGDIRILAILGSGAPSAGSHALLWSMDRHHIREFDFQYGFSLGRIWIPQFFVSSQHYGYVHHQRLIRSAGHQLRREPRRNRRVPEPRRRIRWRVHGGLVQAQVQDGRQQPGHQHHRGAKCVLLLLGQQLGLFQLHLRQPDLPTPHSADFVL